MGLPKEKARPAAEYREKTVRDIMCPLENFSSVSVDTSVKNAVYILKNATVNPAAGANCLLVFENKSLVGFVGISQLFASVQPPNLREEWYRGWNVVNWIEPAFIKGLFTNLCLEASRKTVRDIMEPFSSVISAESTLEEAVFKMFREKRDMVPVFEKETLVGIVRAGELFLEIASIMV
ncbi:MAG: CBS domain-containing protein [Actinobacteria bacterium]|nr:CBS domain-containing protein [Actinomycetota bacterium]